MEHCMSNEKELQVRIIRNIYASWEYIAKLQFDDP